MERALLGQVYTKYKTRDRWMQMCHWGVQETIRSCLHCVFHYLCYYLTSCWRALEVELVETDLSYTYSSCLIKLNCYFSILPPASLNLQLFQNIWMKPKKSVLECFVLFGRASNILPHFICSLRDFL